MTPRTNVPFAVASALANTVLHDHAGFDWFDEFGHIEFLRLTVNGEDVSSDLPEGSPIC